MLHKYTIGTLAACFILTSPASAHQHETPAKAPPQEDHSEMNHSDVNHAKMDHSTHDMNPSTPRTAPMQMPTGATLITAKVNGLVCDFCAQALRKVFKKEEAVDHINVDLDAGQVLIALNPEGSLDDAHVKKLIRNSGYSLVSISRSDEE